LGAHPRSYAYSSTGKLINNAKTFPSNRNESCTPGDIIGALIHLKPPKPAFLQKKPSPEGWEISDGSFIEFYRNGVKQSHTFVEIFEGPYRAGISLYMSAQCKVNFGT